MYTVSKRVSEAFGEFIRIRYVKSNGFDDPYKNAPDALHFFDPVDAITAALYMKSMSPNSSCEIIDEMGLFIFQTKKYNKLRRWAEKEKSTLQKCARCYSCLKDNTFKSKASFGKHFCTELCAIKDELDKPMNDNEETEFEI